MMVLWDEQHPRTIALYGHGRGASAYPGQAIIPSLTLPWGVAALLARRTWGRMLTYVMRPS
jgi:hypothetical protein